MAIIDQARFYDARGLNAVELGNALADWFRLQGFEWRTYNDPTGRYVVQVRKASTARSIFGLNYALTVAFKPQSESKLLIELGGADWTDKIVSGAVGIMLIYPLVFTAGYGAWQQSELTNKVWDFLNGYVYNRTGQTAGFAIAMPYYTGTPGYNPNVPPPPGSYQPYAPYPTAATGFPTVAPSATPAARSWFNSATMQPIFEQQVGKMVSWQNVMADGKIVDQEISQQTEKVEKLRQKAEEQLDTAQRIKLAEILTAMAQLEAAPKTTGV